MVFCVGGSVDGPRLETPGAEDHGCEGAVPAIHSDEMR